MSTEHFEIMYAAHTSSCTFLLDAEGICRRIVLAPSRKRREASHTVARCVGAQYVASLDALAAGGLVEMPRPGAAMLFARVDERGRVSLVRTGVVTRFETRRSEDPFAETSGVATSAPDITRRTDESAVSVRMQPPPRTMRMHEPDYGGADNPTRPLNGQQIAAARASRPSIVRLQPSASPRRRAVPPPLPAPLPDPHDVDAAPTLRRASAGEVPTIPRPIPSSLRAAAAGRRRGE